MFLKSHPHASTSGHALATVAKPFPLRFSARRNETSARLRARTVHSVSRPSLSTPHNDATRTPHPHHTRHHTRRAHQPHAGIHRYDSLRARREIFPSPRLARASTHHHHHHPKPIARAHAHTPHPTPSPSPSPSTRTTHRARATRPKRVHAFVWSFKSHSFARERTRIASHRIAPVKHRARKTHRRSHRARRRHRSTPPPRASSPRACATATHASVAVEPGRRTRGVATDHDQGHPRGTTIGRPCTRLALLKPPNA